jgi:hypothetical protein
MNIKQTQSIVSAIFLFACAYLSNCTDSSSINEGIKFEKISELPITMKSNYWSAKAGDSIFFRALSSLDEEFAVINVKDPANPKIDGYIDSTTLLTYPAETMIPFSLKSGVYNRYQINRIVKYKDLFLVTDYPTATFGASNSHCTLKLFQASNNDLVLIDSLVVTLWDSTSFGYYSCGLNLLQLGDNVIAIQYTLSTMTAWNDFCLPLLLSSTNKIIPYPAIPMGESWDQTGTVGNSEYSAINGCFKNVLILSALKDYGRILETILFDFSTNQQTKTQCSDCSLKSQATCSQGFSNTGIIFSPGVYLYSTGQYFFAASAWDIYGYATALENNTVYRELSNVNIFHDSATKKVFILNNNSLVTLDYHFLN